MYLDLLRYNGASGACQRLLRWIRSGFKADEVLELTASLAEKLALAG
jgi:hypothetical protein